MMSTGGLYQIRNQVNGKRYVGRTVSFKSRWADHRKHLRGNRNLSQHLQAAWNKYGEGAFVFEPLIVCAPEEALAIEQLWLDHGVGDYNISKSARSPTAVGQKMSDEFRAKLRSAHLGKPLSPEHRASISAANKGRKHSPEHVAKRAAARGNKSWGKHAPETKLRIGLASALRVRKPFTPEARAKMRASRLAYFARLAAEATHGNP